MKTQEQRNQEMAWDKEDRDIRRNERALDREETRGSDRSARLIGIGVALVTFMLFIVPMKVVDWSNCTDACEANGDKPFWRISMGCFCDDGDGLYNPKDER